MFIHPIFFDPAKPTVLLIEDEADVRQGLVALLKDSYNVLEAGTGREAVQLYEQYQMKLSAVLLDIRLPDISGLEVLKKLKAINVAPSIIMATAIKDQPSAIQALQDGAADYLVKPFLAADVQASVKRCVDQKDYRRKIREVKEISEKQAVLSERRDILAQAREMKEKLAGRTLHPLERYTFFDALSASLDYQGIVNLLEKDLKEKAVFEDGPGQARVLIVEDEPDIQSSLKDLLSGKYKVSQAFDAAQALDLLARERFDVMLLDIRLPDKSGIEILQSLQKMNTADPEELSIIMTTALKDIQSAVEAFRYGAYDYLTKPVRIDDINRTIQRALENKNYKKVLRKMLEKLRRENIDPEQRLGLLNQYAQKQRQKRLPVTLGDVLTFFPEYYTGDFDSGLLVPDEMSAADALGKLALYYQRKQEQSARGLSLPPEVPEYIRQLLREQADQK